MANKKISELAEATVVNNSDYLMVVQDGVNKKVTADKVKGTSAAAVAVTDLAEASVVNDIDYLTVTQDGVTKKVTADKVKGSSTVTNTVDVNFANYTEVLTVANASYILVNQDGINKKVQVSAVKGASNLTDKFVEVIGDDGVSYRMTVKNGKFYAYPAAVDTSVAAVAGSQLSFDGLIINRMFGGGSALLDTSCSHSFIELYNLGVTAGNTRPINLNGLYLWYKDVTSAWQSLPLKGIIPPNTSFLIRCGFHNDPHKDVVRIDINDYDMEWDIKLSDKGFTALIYIGATEPEANPVRFTFDAVTKAKTWTNTRYVDMLGVGGKQLADNPPAAELRYIKCMDRYTGVMREDFANAGLVNIGTNKKVVGNNEADCIPVNFATCDVQGLRPRSLIDGEWSVSIKELQLKPNIPNMLNISFGENGDTTRSFTWQSTPVTDRGFLKYRLTGETDWTVVNSIRNILNMVDSQSTIHHLTITGLVAGVYEYVVGEEGYWSDLSTFEVKLYDATHPIKFLITTDEQAFTDCELKASAVGAAYIEANEMYDWHLNPGDISQNGNRPFEWRNYFRQWTTNKKVCHMMTCGNNDLVDKKYSDCFVYYTTNENSAFNSVYSYDLGFAHFVHLNSNPDMTYVDGSIGGYATTDLFLAAECAWLDAHLTAVEARSTKPRWVIATMHQSPFTVGREIRVQPFAAIFEKHKVDVVFCGHNHAYSRSIPLKTGFDFAKNPVYNTYTIPTGGTAVVAVEEYMGDGITPITRTPDIANGVTYILAQSTGFKLTGKELPIVLPQALVGTKHANAAGQPWWYVKGQATSQPSYMKIEVNWDFIKADAYTIGGVITKDVNLNLIVNDYIPSGVGAQTRVVLDTVTINYADRNKA